MCSWRWEEGERPGEIIENDTIIKQTFGLGSSGTLYTDEHFYDCKSSSTGKKIEDNIISEISSREPYCTPSDTEIADQVNTLNYGSVVKGKTSSFFPHLPPHLVLAVVFLGMPEDSVAQSEHVLVWRVLLV